MSAILLDTCAAIWLGNGDPMAPDAVALMQEAARQRQLYVSPVSAWEVGLIAHVRRSQAPPFLPDPRAWFDRLVNGPGLVLTPLTVEAAILASSLPGELHKDPADRLLIATAKVLNIPLVTRDSHILAYASAGHVQGIAC